MDIEREDRGEITIEEVPEWMARFDAAEEHIQQVKEELFRAHVRDAGMAGARRYRRLYGRRPRSRRNRGSRRYLVVVERTPTGFSAYLPDLPGCAATGATRLELDAKLRGAVRLHVRGMRTEGLPLPDAETSIGYIDVPL